MSRTDELRPADVPPVVKRWLAVINHSRASGKPPETVRFDWHGDLQRYFALESDVIQITIYRSVKCGGEPSRYAVQDKPV